MAMSMIAPGSSEVPSHFHLNEDEWFIVIKGQLQLVINGETKILAEGENCRVKKGETHSWKAVGESVLHLLVIFSPAGIEEMFKELDAAPHKVKEISKVYGTEFL